MSGPRKTRVRLSVESLENRDVPSGTPLIALGTNGGMDPRVRVINQDTGAVLFEPFAFAGEFRGGTRVAVGDVTGDGQDDVVVGSGPGRSPQVAVYDGTTGAEVSRFDVPAAKTFRGGITVAAGDLDGDGKAEVIVGLDAGSTPTVTVFDGTTGAVARSFLAAASTARVGVRVAAGDLDGDGKAEIVAGLGFGAAPLVKTFDAAGQQKLVVTAFSPKFRGGVNVAVADTDGDGRGELVVGAGYGGGGKVQLANGATGALGRQFVTPAAGGRGGARVAGAAVDADGLADILTASGDAGFWSATDAAGVKFSDNGAPGFSTGVWIAASPQTAKLHRAAAGVALAWNAAALDAIKATNTPPPKASRALAMAQIAVYDAVNGFAKAKPNTVATGGPAAGASASAAVVMAACFTLDKLFPAEMARFHTLAGQQLGLIPDGPDKSAGIAWGVSVSDQVIAARSADHSGDTTAYTPGTAPGDWQPTPGAFAPALLPGWGNVTPFGIPAAKVADFVAGPPPALTSFTYASDFNIVKDYGSATSALRTADQTEIARFWADGGGTFTPPGHWNDIAAGLSRDDALSLYDTAHLFAQLDTALADAGIVCWKTKFTYNYWRPVTAIRAGDTDNNPYTLPDASWTPLLTTPPFPEYTSGHSTFSGAASAVLAAYFGADRPFSTTSADGAVTRHFNSFAQAADEAGMSRIYGGIHFMSANLNGLAAGRALAAYELSHAS